MRPLVYLFVRSFVNSVRRALTSPRRLISLIIFGLYYFRVFIGPFNFTGRSATLPPGMGLHLRVPSVEIVDGVAFGLMALASIMMMGGVLGYKGGFKPADVDVLFPTPVSPRVVLLFRIVRDYLLTLLVPLLFAIIGWRGTSLGYRALFVNFPERGGDVLRSLWIAWMLLALVWVSIGYAASLFVNRSDLRSDRNRRVITLSLVAVLGLATIVAAVRLRADFSWATALSLTQMPLYRLIFLPGTAASAIVTGTFLGDSLRVALGVGGLLALSALALRVALTQVDWLYDQAAARGFDAINLRKLQRSGDTFGVLAEQARRGKVRQGRLAGRVAALRVRRGGALVWREAILVLRGGGAGVLLVGLFSLGFSALLVWGAGHESPSASGPLVLIVQGFTVFMLSVAGAQSGFIELLRRVDLQKPLPFTPTATVFWEVAAKSVFPILIGWASSVVCLGMAPAAWPYALAGLLLVPAYSLMMTATVFLSVVLFPDLDDPTQRGLRQIVLLLAVVIFGAPGVGVMGLLMAFMHLNPFVAAIPATGLTLALALGVSALSGNFYATFNPSE